MPPRNPLLSMLKALRPSRLSRWLRHYLPFLLPLLILLTLPAFALARAGGGEGFGGGDGGGGGGGWGGGGGSGGGGGGGGIVWLIFYWVEFCVDYPFIGLPITAVVGFAIFYTHRSGMAAYRGSVIRRGFDAADTNSQGLALATASDADPNFSVTQFAGRVKTAFLKIQSAWCAQDMAPAWAFISDGVHERFSIQLQEQKALGYQDRMENISVQNITLIEYTPGEVFDFATVRIDASSSDYRVSLATGKRVDGITAVQPFVEMWSWMRRHGARFDASKPGLIEGNCPNCGAAIEMNQSAKCTHCGALLKSGQFDWVLTEITQESEWRRGRHVPPRGTQDYRNIDPGFSRVDVEDRASVVFWRKTLADRQGKTDPLRKIASDDFCNTYAAQFAPLPDGSRAFFGDCAVGAARLMGLTSEADHDSVVIELAWEGERMIAAPNAPIQRTGQRIQVHTLYLLIRNTGVKSDPGLGVTSAHCPNCGAPFSSDTSSSCSFCGTLLNDGARGWVLSQIASASSDIGMRWIRQIQTPGVPAFSQLSAAASIAPAPIAGPLGLLAWAVKVTAADGNVDPNERALLQSLATKFQIDPNRINAMIEMALNGRLDAPQPPDHQTAYQWLNAIAAAAVVDGRVQPQEAQILSSAAAQFGFSTADVNLMLRQQYAQRFTAARAELRASRRA